MTRYVRSTRSLHAPIVLLALATAAAPLPAQQRPPDRFHAATALSAAAPSALTPTPPASAGSGAAAETARAPLPRVIAGTAVGGALGAGLGALIGWGIAATETENDDGWISTADVMPVLGGGFGYLFGSALGARRAATVDGAGPRPRAAFLASAVGFLAGAVVWNRVGEAFESDYSDSSWRAGAAAGAVTHVLVTSLIAQRAPAAPPVAPPGPPGSPGRPVTHPRPPGT